MPLPIVKGKCGVLMAGHASVKRLITLPAVHVDEVGTEVEKPKGVMDAFNPLVSDPQSCSGRLSLPAARLMNQIRCSASVCISPIKKSRSLEEGSREERGRYVMLC